MSSNQAKNSFWEISMEDLEEWCKWNEALAMSWITWKFEWDVESILDRVERFRKYEWNNLYDNY